LEGTHPPPLCVLSISGPNHLNGYVDPSSHITTSLTTSQNNIECGCLVATIWS
jgi:hypothetical protein